MTTTKTIDMAEREMTLRELVTTLPVTHRARREYDELVGQLDAIEVERDAKRYRYIRDVMELCVGDAPICYLSGDAADAYVDSAISERAQLAEGASDE